MSQEKKRIPVAVLGATGMVGQRFIEMLADHPWFELAAVTGSERRAGQRYGDAVVWRLPSTPPAATMDLPLLAPDAEFDAPIVFSALPTDVAESIEPLLASRGHAVFSNASSYRMAEDVPLVVAEVNADHLQIVEQQRSRRGWKGFIVTNGNCVAIPVALALKPLQDAFGVRKVLITTMQAITGAGYPGVASYDILGNVIPYINTEEEKVEIETQKFLGAYRDGAITSAPITVSAQCNRVAVRDGHMVCVSVELGRDDVSSEDLIAAFREFRGEPQQRGLPSAPTEPIVVRDERDRPQPARDADVGEGMAVVVGRVRPCSILGHKFVLLGNNTIRGAAGASILNAELMADQGVIGA
ncbi:MAG TPA: aspartate-semialdehyde dehydrogenase [Ktedonobacterales bacterium]|nr:aspartate-semialdehyde dehydrogenase [Ktedonobacterales bacterium]